MKPLTRLAIFLSAMALVAAACGDTDEAPTTVATTTTAPPAGPIIIGAAVDLTADMAPFNSPANTAAEIMVERINAQGGVLGRQLELRTIDDQLDPELSKAAAIDLIGQGAIALMVTCDVDFSTPAIQEALNAGVLVIAPCVGTDQVGPLRFGEAGKIAFSFGNLAQDEGAVLAEFATDQGWNNALIVKDNLIVYFQDVVDAFGVRFQELGGTVVATEEWTGFDGTIGNVVTAVANNQDKDVIAISTAFADLPAFVAGLRSLGDETPILCSWACDGTFWVPEGLSNFWYNTFVSMFGDDPDPEVNAFMQEMTDRGAPPLTGSFVAGAQALQAIAVAIEATGSTDGQQLAAFIEGFDNRDLIFGDISFSSDFHTVFGRPHRIMQFTNSVPAFVEVRTATTPADIG